MEKGNVTELADVKNDSRLISPERCLLNCLEEIRSKLQTPNRVVVIYLDDLATTEQPQKYNMAWKASNISSVEMIALLEVVKIDLLKSMGYG